MQRLERGETYLSVARAVHSNAAMSEYHEPDSELSNEVRDLHRALSSLKEEIEAVDWYHQRWSTSKDEALRSVLAHNRDEEIEHACMMLEWLRRNSPKWDEQLRKQLFKDGPVAAEADGGKHGGGEGGGEHGGGERSQSDLGIGSLKRPR